MHPGSVRDVKKREVSRRNPGDFQPEDDSNYSGRQVFGCLLVN